MPITVIARGDSSLVEAITKNILSFFSERTGQKPIPIRISYNSFIVQLLFFVLSFQPGLSFWERLTVHNVRNRSHTSRNRNSWKTKPKKRIYPFCIVCAMQSLYRTKKKTLVFRINVYQLFCLCVYRISYLFIFIYSIFELHLFFCCRFCVSHIAVRFVFVLSHKHFFFRFTQTFVRKKILRCAKNWYCALYVYVM